MSNLGGNSMSEETDRSNNLQGDKGDTGSTGDTGAQGDQGDQGDTGATGPAGSGAVDTVVGGTNCSVDSADAANPIVNADTQTTNTTKGDLEGFSTVAARIPVGTNDEVLTADSTTALGLAWKTPGSGSESLQAIPPGTGFGILGEAASRQGALTVSTLSANSANIDLIYFNGTTTVTDVSMWSVSAPTAGIDIHVALHPVIDKGAVGDQAHLAKITTVATALLRQNKVISSPWQPAKGWYWLVVWVPTAVTGLLFSNTNAHAGFIGQSISGYTMFSAVTDSVENGQYVLIDSNYSTAPDTVITAKDFNDDTGAWAFTGSQANLYINSVVAIVVLKAG